jgi:co-chaperonin GroES (HSP10)
MAAQEFVLNKSEIYKMRLMPNYVLIKIDNPAEYFKTDSGIYIYVDSEVPVAHHANRNGIVVSVCEHLNFSQNSYAWNNIQGKEYKIDYLNGVETDRDIEIVPGDRVWFSYLDGLNCKEYAQLEFEEINAIKIQYKYKLLKHDSLRLMEHEGIKQTLNGYVLVEPIIEKKSELLEVVDKKKDFNKGIVRYMGTPNRTYKTKTNFDDFDFKPGDTIYFKNYNVEFEYAYLKQIKENIWTVRGCDIMAVEI